MSRYCGDVNADPILEAAARWKTEGLLADRSVLSGLRLWTVEGLELLEHHFIQNLDEGQGSFLSKLETQLQPAPPHAKQLAAELLWVMLLCPSNTRAPKKREIVRTIWEWSREPLPQPGQALSNGVLGGIGSAGPGFNNHRWRELVFSINVALQFKRLSLEERERLLSEPWAFAEWIESVPDSSARQFRHMVLFLLFPDQFERIFGKGDRRAVAVAFSGLTQQTVNAMSPLELDRTLYRVRTDLEQRHGTQQLDYYVPPLAGQWKPQDLSAVAAELTSDHVLQAIAEIEREGVPPGAESTGYDLLYATKRYPPKLVLSLASRYARGVELDRAQFSGGEDSSAFRLLRALGFEIVPKTVLADVLRRFLEQATAAENLSVSGYPAEYRGLQVKVSFGKGNHARVPWVGFFGSGHTPTKGCYPVVLYYRQAQRLIVAYGVSETTEAPLVWGALARSQTIDQYFAVNLDREPERYGDSFVANAFEVTAELDLESVAAAVDGVIDVYKPLLTSVAEPVPLYAPMVEDGVYTLEDATEGLFIEQEVFAAIVERLRAKRNLILQGPPGVGKTFFARRLAMALMGTDAPSRLAGVQFHQTYSYEDFVQGYRPSGTGFTLRNGLFYEFCRKAAADPEHDHVFIIDEINRGNLSKVFGELLMLIEADKRSPEWAIPLTYSTDASEAFHVPPNLYLLGLMNTADRSLAMVDYALRRRFAFVDLEPGFGSSQFIEYMRNARAPDELVQRIIDDMTALNAEIADDRANLGPGFRIGHSYFCGQLGPTGKTEAWYQDIIRTEVLPLLREYWFDDPARMQQWERRLGKA